MFDHVVASCVPLQNPRSPAADQRRRHATHRSGARELRSQWQHAAKLLLREADIGAFSTALELALFYDAKLDVSKITGKMTARNS